MGLVFSKLWVSLFGSREYKVCLVGLNAAGKTTTLYKMVLDDVVHTAPTIGSNVEEFTRGNIKFLMCDLGGQASLRNTWSTYFVDSDVIIFVVDSSDRKRIGLAHDTLNDVLQAEALTGGVLRARALMRRPSLLTLSAAAPLLVFANKQDVAGALTASEISQQLGLSAIKNRTWRIEACCALTGDGCVRDGRRATLTVVGDDPRHRLNAGLDWIVAELSKTR